MTDSTAGPELDELRRELLECGKLIDASKGQEANDLFHEFMENRELGLALLVVCDYLLEERPAALDAAELTRIQRLREQMQLEDSCFGELEALLAARE